MTMLVKIRSQSGLSGPQHEISAELGRHIRTNPEPIAKHCLQALAPVSEDIATIVESLALADRIQTRRRSEGWSREFHLEIPVYEHARFSDPLLHDALIEAAEFLTGDNWHIDFVPRSGIPLNAQYLRLVEEDPKFVVPFSDGLDSFAQSKLLRADHGDAAVWEVRAGRLQNGSGRAGRPLLEVPRGFRAGHPRERTYRTRPLVYFSIAAIAAATAKAEAVVIGENGQGALGPSLARFGNEWPFRSAHPGFVFRLSDFLTRALGTSVNFVQPQLWRTKGEVLSELRDRDLLTGWESTQSCSMRPLQRKKRKACGLCGGCLLRQTAGSTANIPWEKDVSFDVRSRGLTVTSKDNIPEPMGQNEREILARAGLSMSILASHSVGSESVVREARDISGVPKQLAEANLLSLVQRHAAEWSSFLERLPKRAWLRTRFFEQ